MKRRYKKGGSIPDRGTVCAHALTGEGVWGEVLQNHEQGGQGEGGLQEARKGCLLRILQAACGH